MTVDLNSHSLLTRRLLIGIVLVGVIGVAAYATTMFLLQHNFPAGPKPATSVVHITSPCTTLAQAFDGPGVFTNTTGTFVQKGTAVGILYACSVTSLPYTPAFTVVQETLVKAPGYPSIFGLSEGALYVIVDGRPSCNPSTVGISISNGTASDLGSGDYDYCLVINNYTGQVQPFTVTWSTSLAIPAHRLIFMTAIIHENGGFGVTGLAFLNQSSLPSFDATDGPDLTGVDYTNYTVAGGNTIHANVGDTLTLYIQGLNSTNPAQVAGVSGHGFEISGPSTFSIDQGALPGTIPFGKWFTITVTFWKPGTYLYFCTIVCSPAHALMNGSLVIT